jgi:hypothetical protein
MLLSSILSRMTTEQDVPSVKSAMDGKRFDHKKLNFLYCNVYLSEHICSFVLSHFAFCFLCCAVFKEHGCSECRGVTDAWRPWPAFTRATKNDEPQMALS